MKDNKNKPTMLLEKVQKDRLRRMAGLIPLNENLYGNLQEGDEEELKPEPDGDESSLPPADDTGPESSGGELGLDTPAPDLGAPDVGGMNGGSDPMVQKLLDLLRPALEQAVAGGQLSISDDELGGSDDVPPVDMGTEDDLGGDMPPSDQVPPGPDGLPGDDDPLKEAVPLPSPVGMKEKYQALEEKIFERLEKRLRKEGLLPAPKKSPTVPANKSTPKKK